MRVIFFFVLCFLFSSSAQAEGGTVYIPVNIVITTPFLEMTYEEAVAYCNQSGKEDCQILENINDIEVKEEDGFTLYEILDDRGELGS